MKRIEVAIAVVARDGKILICRRKSGDTFGGYWEFPGGKREAGEEIVQCLQRELMEELGIGVKVLEKFSPIEHDYPNIHVTLHPFWCEHACGEIRPMACETTEWVEPERLSEYQFPEGNASLLGEIVGRSGSKRSIGS